MAKKLIATQYVFDAINDTVQVKDNWAIERLLLIIDVTINKIIYNFADPAKGATASYDSSTGYTTFSLNLDVSAEGAASSDNLQIFVEEDAVKFAPDETYVDPVSKIRVSQPENLIDTDFEYGLQSTKWETLELVKNVPTFFSRNGDQDFALDNITVTTGSSDVIVTTLEAHSLTAGTPVIVQGSSDIAANGSFVVTSVINTTTFVYKAKRAINSTGSIKDTYTQVFLGSVYQGTEFRIGQIDSINRSSAGGSNDTVLTVDTEFPAPLSVGTSFFLVNSLGVANISFDSTEIIISPKDVVTPSTTNNADETRLGFSKMDVQSYDFTGSDILYFNPTDVTIDQNADTITFSSPHGLTDNAGYVYIAGEGNGTIITEYRGCIVRVLDSTTIYIANSGSFGDTNRRNLNTTSDGGRTRSAFMRAYQVNSLMSNNEEFRFTNTPTNVVPWTQNSPNPVLIFGTADGIEFKRTTDLQNVNESINSTGQVYYPRQTSSGNRDWSFARSAGGAEINFGPGETNYSYYVVPASRLVDQNSINFPDHGLLNNSIIELSASAGSLPSGLSATTYVAEVVNPNAIRFLTFGGNSTVANITSVGLENDVYDILSTINNVNNDSLFLPGNRLTNGQTVIYLDDGNTTIGGLTDNTEYFVFNKTSDRIKLATTQSGYSGNDITGAHSTAYDDAFAGASAFGAFNIVSHGLSNGNIVQYFSTTPLQGLQNGAYYYVNVDNANNFSLFWDSARTDDVKIGNANVTGTFTFKRTTLVDLTTAGTGTHIIQAVTAGASDGVYSIARTNSTTQFEFDTGQDIPARVITIDTDSGLDLKNNTLHGNNHGFVTGSIIEYSTTGTAIGGLTNSTTYYVIVVNKDWFRLATTLENAQNGVAIDLTTTGSGVHTFTTNSITGEIAGSGTVSFTSGSVYAEGTATNFTGIFSPGDKFKINVAQEIVTVQVTATNANNTFTNAGGHSITTEDPVIMNSVTAPIGTINGYIYYARAVSTTEVTLHPTPADATANTNIINITSDGTTVALDRITEVGSIVERTIKYVNSAGSLQMETAFATTGTDLQYLIGTALIVRSDGFALHRPYDGGVELIPSANPDSTMIRQTRKYFRYQSGKGIQNSIAVNFSPSTDIDTFSRSGTTATITTRFPHRLTVGLEITVENATVTSGTNYWNDTFTVATIPDEYTFTVTLAGTPTDNAAGGIPSFYVVGWQNSRLQCGLFDDQNGIFWEYDGQELHACRRSSVQQLSGTVSVTFRSGLVVGTNTKFSSQLIAGDKIVIKGMTYEVSQVDNDTTLYILPTYRGVTQSNVIITKTITTRTPQTQWNVDVCDGTGKSGYILNVDKIQMCYIDYSWYGAGKVRFGFKDQNGKVIYVHEYIHNNKFNEAYMRSGNLPGRYQIQNVGTPTYVPALAHWGTSVIMDGRFDDDKAYIFNAQSNNITLLGSGTSVVASARAFTDTQYDVRSGNNWRNIGYALELETPSGSYNSFTAGMAITGTGFTGALANPITSALTAQPYQPSIFVRFDDNSGTRATKTLLVIDGQPSGTAGSYSDYTITTSTGNEGASTSIVRDIPLISIRLSPSVDTNTPGFLGEREIINRMQLILSQVQILTTHAVDVKLVLNGQVDDNNWSRVTNPSLSQLVYHNTEDTIVGGNIVYSFRAQGGTGTTGRTPVANTEQLGEVATLGNSILGGNGVFPDGPDVLTVVATIVEDPSTVSTTNPFEISGRISWTESQA